MSSNDALLFKVLNADRTPCYGGRGGPWPYRRWTSAVKPIPCSQGWHVCTLDQLPQWLGPAIWLVEVRGEVIDGGNKLVAEQARLVRKLPWKPRLFAADCAEHVLHIYEDRFPGDDRPRKAIEAARSGNKIAGAYAADASAAVADASAAVADAAADVAYGARAADADAAAYAAYAAARAADAAARAAARAADAAARAAAYAAARAVGADGEREWQIQRLAEHLGVNR